jgi:hypothetical protein
LLSAVVAALLVVANQVVDTWTEGHLLMAWISCGPSPLPHCLLVAGTQRRQRAAHRPAAWSASRKRH